MGAPVIGFFVEQCLETTSDLFMQPLETFRESYDQMTDAAIRLWGFLSKPSVSLVMHGMISGYAYPKEALVVALEHLQKSGRLPQLLSTLRQSTIDIVNLGRTRSSLRLSVPGQKEFGLTIMKEIRRLPARIGWSIHHQRKRENPRKPRLLTSWDDSDLEPEPWACMD
jgi:hypothetical protein